MNILKKFQKAELEKNFDLFGRINLLALFVMSPTLIVFDIIGELPYGTLYGIGFIMFGIFAVVTTD